jgi:hypothetical protein
MRSTVNMGAWVSPRHGTQQAPHPFGCTRRGVHEE